jgi:hypothetical protein
MKASKLRELIGKDIEWTDHPDCRGWCRGKSGTIVQVSGRNVLIDSRGSQDWHWLPQMINIKPKDSRQQPGV